MKQILLAAGLGLALTGCMTSTGWSEAPLDDSAYAAPPPVAWWGRDVASVDVFYGPLAQHGYWGNHARYGRVFLPSGVGPGWQPYSRGYWRQDARYGRVFVSADPWGWATYHYGRWGRDDRFGWFWVPDTRFGPNWVDWRDGAGYASWSPLPPPGWSSWGYGWGNDWWLHAPGAWVYRPGLYDHVRRGRHDWDGRDWDGRDRDHRDRDRHDRDRDKVVDRTPQTLPPWQRNVHPRSTPDGGKPSPAWADGNRPPPAQGWQGGERHDGASQRGRHPRSSPVDAGVGLARSRPASPEGAVRRQPAARAEAPAREVRSARAEPQARSAPAERPQRETVVRETSMRETSMRGSSARGRDVPARVADD